GHSFKYYTVEFKLLNPLDINTFNNPVLKQLTFHQRSIFSVGATSVPWESFHVCDYGLDDSYVINQIKCFQDELSNSNECDSEENYFTYFSLDENKINSTIDRKSTRLNSSHVKISYAVFCLKKKNNYITKEMVI